MHIFAPITNQLQKQVQVTEYYPDTYTGTETVDGVTLTNLAGQLRRTADGALMCMYVRRELRVLTESDLNDTMNAMAVLWSTDEVCLCVFVLGVDVVFIYAHYSLLLSNI